MRLCNGEVLPHDEVAFKELSAHGLLRLRDGSDIKLENGDILIGRYGHFEILPFKGNCSFLVREERWDKEKNRWDARLWWCGADLADKAIFCTEFSGGEEPFQEYLFRGENGFLWATKPLVAQRTPNNHPLSGKWTRHGLLYMLPLEESMKELGKRAELHVANGRALECNGKTLFDKEPREMCFRWGSLSGSYIEGLPMWGENCFIGEGEVKLPGMDGVKVKLPKPHIIAPVSHVIADHREPLSY